MKHKTLHAIALHNGRNIMKHHVQSILQYLPWLLLLIGVDGFAALLLWLTDAQAFYSLSVVILLSTLLLFSVLCYVLVRQEQKKEQAFFAFLYFPDEYHEQLLLKAAAQAQADAIRCLGRILRDKQTAYTGLQEQLNDYEEYVESWAHEAKTPLSLLTLLLDNRRDELPAPSLFKLDHIRNRIQESVDQMLFYARLKGVRKDYLFESVRIRTCVEDLLEDYKPLLDEKRFEINCMIGDDTVYSDQRGLRFLLGQIISNSIKYCAQKPKLCLRFFRKDDCCVLSVTDNGMGVKSCDLPYIFEKGFTGDSGDGRKKATGMGLYLANEIAKELNISLHADSEWGNGFTMQLAFPIVDDLQKCQNDSTYCFPYTASKNLTPLS